MNNTLVLINVKGFINSLYINKIWYLNAGMYP